MPLLSTMFFSLQIQFLQIARARLCTVTVFYLCIHAMQPELQDSRKGIVMNSFTVTWTHYHASCWYSPTVDSSWQTASQEKLSVWLKKIILHCRRLLKSGTYWFSNNGILRKIIYLIFQCFLMNIFKTYLFLYLMNIFKINLFNVYIYISQKYFS